MLANAQLSLKGKPICRGIMEQLLNVPCPPSVEQAIGYLGDCRYVGFYWEPSGDEVIHTDGMTTSTGNWRTYLTFLEHPKVATKLFGQVCTHNASTTVAHCDHCQNRGWFSWHFGDSETVGDHILLLDRTERVWFAGSRRSVSQHLHQQHPLVTPLVVSSEAWQALVKGLEARMQEAQEAHTVLLRSGQWQAASERAQRESEAQRQDLLDWLDHYQEAEAHAIAG
jgi:hypothetical protein